MRRRSAKDNRRGKSAGLAGKTVVVGVSGGIAAYKSADLVSRLVRESAQVHVVMTLNATEFIAPLTFRALSNNPVLVEMFSGDGPYPHIDLGKAADILVVAPATANIIGKFAWGIADDALSTLFLSTKAPVLIAPAMNETMYEHPAVQQNIESLLARGCAFVGPESGRLGCGDEGKGRMTEPADIVAEIKRLLTRRSNLAGRKIVVTAGPTAEPIDPVRVITNRSSGKQGYAIAQEAAERGASVVLISGPTQLRAPTGVETIRVETAKEMLAEAKKAFRGCDAFIGVAAVSDFRPKTQAPEKIKKDAQGKGISLELAQTPDILKELSRSKGRKVLVGFAAETGGDAVAKARRKLREKKLDLIVMNDVTQEGAEFGGDTNVVTLIRSDGKTEEIGLATKKHVAARVIDSVSDAL
jgi:phosphopantothenoylcysteine decarboxylase/phosphopantothenate--cysteine ligase